MVTPAQVLATVDKWSLGLLRSDMTTQVTEINAAQSLINGDGSTVYGTGDPVFISALGVPNKNMAAAADPDIQNKAVWKIGFGALYGYFTRNTGFATLDAYLTNANATPYTCLPGPNTAYQYWLVNGKNNQIRLSPSNVFAPQTNFGAAVVGAGPSIVYTDAFGVPTANNTSAVQTLTLVATGGTFVPKDGLGHSAAAQAWNVSAATLQAAMTGLTGVGAGNLAITGPNGGPFVCAAQGALAASTIHAFAVDGSALTGGGHSASWAQTVVGGAQGYCPVADLRANVTVNINNTLTITVTGKGWDAAGVAHTGRTWTIVLDNLNAGQHADATPTIGGDRLAQITGVAISAGAATAGAFTLDSVLERIIS